MTVSALLAGFDAAEWAGEVLFSRNGNDVSAPAVDVMHDGGHYPDAVAMLNGWGTERTLTRILQDTWTLDGVPSMSLTADGLLELTITYEGSHGEVILSPGAADPWGWGGSLSSVGVGDTEVLSARTRWQRGRFRADSDAVFTLLDFGGAGEGPGYLGAAQSLPHWLQSSSVVDADAITAAETVEGWDVAANDAVLGRIKWGVDDDGRTFTSWPSAGLGAPYGVTWASATFMRALGFTGAEAAVLRNGVHTLTSTFPALGVLILRQRLAVYDAALEHRGEASETLGGRVVGRPHSFVRDLVVSTTLRGGLGFSPGAESYRDEVEIYLRRVAPLLWPGARVTVCPEWGDPRLARGLVERFQSDGTHVRSGFDYPTMGRLRCEVSAGSERRHALSWAPNAPRIITSAPVSWLLRQI